MSQAPGNEIPHTLAALDWGGITCQSGAGCTNRASYVVHLHAVDECNDPDLDPFGNTSKFCALPACGTSRPKSCFKSVGSPVPRARSA